MNSHALRRLWPLSPALFDEAMRMARFGAVGLVNTAIGAGVIALALYGGMDDYAANAAGYALGLISSYLLNRRFTFGRNGAGGSHEKLRFGLTALISYLVNLAVIVAGRKLGAGGTMTLQLVAMAAYTVVFYALSRCFVFVENPTRAQFDVRTIANSNTTVALLVIAAALPVLTTPILPFMDLGGHLGRYAVQIDAGRSADIAQWYSFSWGLLPNLGVDLLVQALAPLIGLEPAVHLVVGGTAPLAVLGMLMLARAVHGRIPPSAGFALPLAYGLPYLAGFANYSLGIALALNLAALWIRLGDAGRIGLRSALFVPLGFALWLCHLVAFAVFGIIVGCTGIDRLMRRGASPLRALLLTIAMMLPLLAGPIAGVLVPHRHDAGPAFEYVERLWRLPYIMNALKDRWPLWDAAGAAVLVMVALTVGRWRGWGHDRGLLAAGLLLGAIFAVMPDVIFGSHYADLRLAPMVLVLVILSAAPTVEALDARKLALVLMAALAFCGVRLAGNGASMALYGRQFESSLAVLDALPRGSNLVTLFVAKCEGLGFDRRHHLSGYALARRHAFDNGQWEMPSGQLLQVHNASAEPFVRDPSQVTYLTSCRGSTDLFGSAQVMPRAIDWLWVIGTDPVPTLPGWRMAVRSGDSILFQRAR